MNLHGRNDFPRNDRTIDGSFRQGIGNARQRHAHRNCAQSAHQLGHLAGRRTHLQTLHVCHVSDSFVGGVNNTRAVYLQSNDVRFLELIGCHGLHIFPIGFGGGLCVGHHERQLKHFNAGETTCGVARQCPDDVDHTVAGLIVQLHRRTAQLHGRVSFKFDAATRVFFNLVHPCFVHVEPHIGLGRHEGVKFEGHCLLGQTSEGWRCKGRCCTRL